MSDDEEVEEAPAAVEPKGRGRKQPKTQMESPVEPPKRTMAAPALPTAKERVRGPAARTAKAPTVKEATEEPKAKKSKAAPKAKEKDTTKPAAAPAGKLVDHHGRPISKDDIERMSTTSAGSRLRRTRTLSVFRELAPTESGSVGRTGRHHIKPINFWLNERANYDADGNLLVIRQNESVEDSPKKK